MQRRAFATVSLLAVIGTTSTVVGQSVNIDYGEGAGTPPSDYAAAGSPGAWNALSGLVGTPEALVGLDGSPIAATVTLTSGAGGPPRLFDHPGTAGNDEQLLDDHTSGGTDVVGSIFFAGLENGSYEVIVYAWTPSSPDVFTAVWADCTHIISFLIGGAWPGQLEDGITQARFVKTVVDGTLQVCTAGGFAWEGAINGIQLVALDCNDGSGGICTLPPDPGPCDAICPRFYYDTCTERCEPFIWGCCLGNANNFETVEACDASCPVLTVCSLANPPTGDALAPGKSRYITITPGNPGKDTAIRVTLVDVDGFSGFNGETRWVGAPSPFPEEDTSDPERTFVGARLDCAPYFQDWSTIDSLHIFGGEMIPGSSYAVQSVDINCANALDEAASFSAEFVISTGVWGDVEELFDASGNPPQPDFKDIATVVRKFQAVGSTCSGGANDADQCADDADCPGGLCDANAPIKAFAQLQPNVVFPTRPINFKDIAADVAAYVGRSYADSIGASGPCTCPSLVTCGTTACDVDLDCGGGFCIDSFCTDPCGRCTPPTP